jgi:hypothetical protein
MKTVGAVLGAPFKLLGIIPSGKSSTPALPAPLPTPTRDDASAAVSASDALARRRGGAADILTGRGGLEAAAGSTGKTTLGS